MVDRNEVVNKAFSYVGETFMNFNDNRSELFAIADSLLNDVMDDIGVNVNLLFNARSIKFAFNREEDGMNYYNLPVDFMSLINTSAKAFVLGEYIVSEEKDLSGYYCAKIPLTEYPNYMKQILSLMVAERLAFSISTYQDKIQILQSMIAKERVKIMNSEGLI